MRPRVTVRLALLLLALGCQGEERPAPSQPEPAPGAAAAPAPEAEPWAEQVEQLEALGYAAAVEEAVARSGVTVHDAARAAPGWNLYVSGHAPEAVLMDMDGRVRHRWSHDFRALWQRRNEGEPPLLYHPSWRRARVGPDGSLLAIHTNYALIRLDRDSRLVWEYPGRAHHDLDVAPDGRIFVLVNERGVLPRLGNDPVIDDFVVTLDPDGRELARVSLLESIENAGRSDLLARMPRKGELLHTNSLRWLDGSHADALPGFTRGRALVSLLTLSTVAVVDLEQERLVWSLEGDFRFQHDPVLLPNGRMLLFDNLGPALRGHPLPPGPGGARAVWHRAAFVADFPPEPASAVLELEPATGRVAWSYTGTPEHPFASNTSGAAQRLPNGNTLVTESESGRAFEVTPDGEIVWEFLSPHRVGEKVAQLFELQRLPPDFPVSWAAEAPGGAE